VKEKVNLMQNGKPEDAVPELFSLGDLLMLLPEEMSLEELLAHLPEGMSLEELASLLPGDGQDDSGLLDYLAWRKQRRLQLEEKINGDVHHDGYSIMSVFDPAGVKPPYTYTIGLHHTNPDLFDLVMIGLDVPRLRSFISHIAAGLLAGTSYTVGQAYPDIVEDDFPLFFARVEEAFYEQYLGWAIHYYAGQPFPAVQVVWPDAAARFPWQSGFDERFRTGQPLLFHPANDGLYDHEKEQ
jgi:Domain of unknown function (DUF4262)